MRQLVRIGILGAALVAAAGCSTIGDIGEWFGSLTTQSTESAPRTEDGTADTRSAEMVQPTAAATPAPADGKAPSAVETVHVLFAFDRSDLSEAAQTELLALVKKARKNSKLTVQLEGYADSVGPREYNLQLTQKRMESVRRYLVEKGVEAPRIRSSNLGPVADGGGAQERAKNRRVTVKLVAASN